MCACTKEHLTDREQGWITLITWHSLPVTPRTRRIFRDRWRRVEGDSRSGEPATFDGRRRTGSWSSQATFSLETSLYVIDAGVLDADAWRVVGFWCAHQIDPPRREEARGERGIQASVAQTHRLCRYLLNALGWGRVGGMEQGGRREVPLPRRAGEAPGVVADTSSRRKDPRNKRSREIPKDPSQHACYAFLAFPKFGPFACSVCRDDAEMGQERIQDHIQNDSFNFSNEKDIRYAPLVTQDFDRFRLPYFSIAYPDWCSDSAKGGIVDTYC